MKVVKLTYPNVDCDTVTEWVSSAGAAEKRRKELTKAGPAAVSGDVSVEEVEVPNKKPELLAFLNAL
jgi:hypothetical protein